MGILDGTRTPEEIEAIRQRAYGFAESHPAELARTRRMLQEGEKLSRWSPSRTKKGPRIDEDPTPQVTVTTEEPWDEFRMEKFADQLGRKIEADDVTEGMRLGARKYVRAYHPDARGDWCSEFIQAMKEKVESLTDGMVKGIANCMVANVRNARRIAERAVAEMEARERIEPTVPGQAAPVEKVTDGMYLHPDERDPSRLLIVKVQKAVHGSGNLYAKVLQPNEYGSAEFVYAPGMIRKLKVEERMTLEQAMEYGALYGVCVRCGRTLTNEKSIEAAMGPVCRKAFI